MAWSPGDAPAPLLDRQHGVLLGHLHEAPLLAALRSSQLHFGAPQLAQPGGDHVALLRLVAHQDLARHLRGLHVILRQELTGRARQLLRVRAIQKPLFLTHQPPAADEEELHASLHVIRHQRDDILLGQLGRDDLLSLDHVLDRLHLIAQAGGLLEVQRLGRLLHLPLELLEDGVALPLQELRHVVHRAPVGGAGDERGARSAAQPDVIIQADLLLVPLLYLSAAGAQLEHLLDDPQRLPHRPGVGVGAEVPVAVLLDLADHDRARERLVHGQADVRILLVIPQADIVVGPVLLDQVRLENQRLDLTVRDERLDVVDPRQHELDARRVTAAFLEVGADPVLEIDRFADVEHLPGLVTIEVHAGAVGEQGQLFLDKRRDNHSVLL